MSSINNSENIKDLSQKLNILADNISSYFLEIHKNIDTINSRIDSLDNRLNNLHMTVNLFMKKDIKDVKNVKDIIIQTDNNDIKEEELQSKISVNIKKNTIQQNVNKNRRATIS